MQTQPSTRIPLRCNVVMLMTALMAALASETLSAGEMGHYVAGSWSPRDLLSAPPGTRAFAPYVALYDARRARTGDGHKVDANSGIDVNANSWMFTPVFVFAPTASLWGADWSITVVPAYGEASANARLTAFELDQGLFDNSNTGIADTYVVPLNLTWHLNDYWAWSFQYAFWAPTGEYDSDRADNVGLGYWSHDFRATASYFPWGNPGLLLSVSVLHEINGEKKGFDLTPADHTALELGASMALSERTLVGLLVHGLWETGDVKGRDATEDGRDRMYGIGLEASYWFLPGKLGTTGRVSREFRVRDRFEGTTLMVGLNFLY